MEFSKDRRLFLRDVPPEERPRERMLRHGAGVLSNAELLAILLRTGSNDESVLTLAHRILAETGGLRGLIEASLDELMNLKGVGPAKAIQIKAALEMGNRMMKATLGERYTIRSPKDAANYMMEELRYLTKEQFVCLFLNTKNQVIGQSTVFVGSLDSSIVHPREIFKEAIRRSSASIICLHNHPSGDPTPSREDIAVTRRLVEAGEIIGIEVLDHVIVGDGRYTSLKEKGFI
ncbi:DNA repair protein RadC [Bacillaceae bacterium]